ncbi:AAEL001392-PA [Aedes aegypti]|uniref:AAEL001392-PA n=1 Tax=Aedes aegypti TaxID=7159 RepID=Q17LF7_AEDAE|nr:AAEL001392-PA [Aedes aegypti]
MAKFMMVSFEPSSPCWLPLWLWLVPSTDMDTEMVASDTVVVASDTVKSAAMEDTALMVDMLESDPDSVLTERKLMEEVTDAKDLVVKDTASVTVRDTAMVTDVDTTKNL